MGKPRIDAYGQVHPPLPSIPLRPLITALLLAAIAFGGRDLLLTLIDSAQAYEPPVVNLAPGDPTQPLTQSLVLVIVDGLRYDTSLEMPNLQSLRRRGAYAQVVVPLPSVSQPSWITLLSGAPPEFNGAALFHPSGEARPIVVDHLLRRARVMRHTTAVAGASSWQDLIPPAALDDTVYAAEETPAADAQLVDAAAKLLRTRYPDVLLVHLSQVDATGHAFGGASDRYYRAALRVDELIRRLANAADLRISALVVVSDHGHLDQGGHGGSEPVVTRVPFVLVGPGVRPGDYGTIPAVDVAPTLAALLGLPIPAESHGTVRFEMLEMSDAVRAEKAMALAAQQVQLAEAYLEAIGVEDYENTPAQELTVAHSAADIDNFAGAFEIAQLSASDAHKAIVDARAARIAAERQERLRVTLGALAALFVLWWFTRTVRNVWLLGVALLAWLGPLGNADALAVLLKLEGMRILPAVLGLLLAVTTVLWAWLARRRSLWPAAGILLGVGLVASFTQEGAFSLSTIPEVGAFLQTMVWRGIAALLLGGVAVLLALWPEARELRRVAQVSYSYVLLLLGVLAIPTAVGYWLHGLRVSWYLPDVMLLFFHFTTLIQLTTVAGLGVLLPLVTVPLYAILRRAGYQRAAGWQAGLEPEAN